MSLSVLQRLQRALEGLYRVDSETDVGDYVISEAARARVGAARAPREQLLLRTSPGGDELEVGLFVDEVALRRLETGGRLDDANLPEFLLAVEGVSHFVYATVRARAGRPFSALELELQAEVDKYLLVLLAGWSELGDERARDDLHHRLFDDVSFDADLSDEERDRYTTANAAAGEYAASLDHRFVRHHAVPDMLDELRRFYRLGCAGKLDHIARKAA